MTTGHRLGELGEDLARIYLQMCGLEFLQSRFRLPGGEIDLVMAHRGVIVFVEVKTRGPGALARPEDFVTHRQLSKLRRAARSWLTDRGAWGRACRFDVVAVEFHGPEKGLEVRHYEHVGGFAK